MKIRKLQVKDIEEVSLLIQDTLEKVNKKDSPVWAINEQIQEYSSSNLKKQTKVKQFYVLVDKSIVAVGAVSKNIISSVFVLSAKRKTGYGSKIMDFLESKTKGEIKLISGPSAKSFYLQRGYSIKKEQIQNKKVTGYHMVKDLKIPSISEFQKEIYRYYDQNKRVLQWRDTKNPYYVLVSELMLQQTQVPRVIIKFKEFIKAFPTIEKLAKAELREVLLVWKGLGYNRRALNLQRSAQEIVKNHKGKIPNNYDDLINLPGIGPATACEILSFAYNNPTVFIETNIRSVFIHFFFKNKSKVSDEEIIPLIEKALDKSNPRQWYYALMDYGVYLKKTINPSKKSKTYQKQSKFEGSNRQLRAKILHEIALRGKISNKELESKFKDRRTKDIISQLVNDQLIKKSKNSLCVR